MAGFRTSSVWLKIAIITLCLAVILFVIAFATKYWVSWPNNAYGLWQGYYQTLVGIVDVDNIPSWLDGHWRVAEHPWKHWYRATQAMETLGMICMVPALILLFIFTCVGSCRRRNLLIAVICLTFFAVGFMVIGIVVFAMKMEDYHNRDVIGWSMGLAMTSCVLAFISAIMSCIELKS